MSDLVDDANDRAQRDLERAIAAARASNGMDCAATGECLNCGEPAEAAFCDADCRDDYQQRKRLQRRTW